MPPPEVDVEERFGGEAIASEKALL